MVGEWLGNGRSRAPSDLYGCFLKWWYHQIIHFNRVFRYKPSILGYPYFWKHPYRLVGGGNSNISMFFYVHPDFLGKFIQFDDHIFQMG